METAPLDPISNSIEDVRPWRLVVTRTSWETALRPALMQNDLFAVGTLRWNTTMSAREILLESVQLTSDVPRGAVQPALADWCVVVVRNHHDSIGDLVRKIHPRPNQLLTVIQLDRGERGRWEGVVVRGESIAPLNEIHIVGPRMLKLIRSDAIPDSAEAWETQRWSRTNGALGADTFQRVRRSTVSIVGAGRNGSMMAFQLAALGVKHLRIIDHDVLSLENLDAMPGLHSRDVGRLKLDALGQRLRQFRPDLQITRLEKPVTDAAAIKLLRERTDCIVTCVDRDTPRLAVTVIARQTLTAHIDVASSVRHTADGSVVISGDARLLLPGEGCVACVGGIANLDETIYDLNAPTGSLPRRLRPAWNEERAGSLITINSLTVGAAVQGWLDLLGGQLRTSFWQRLAWIPGRGLQSNAGPVAASDECRFCHRDRFR